LETVGLQDKDNVTVEGYQMWPIKYQCPSVTLKVSLAV